MSQSVLRFITAGSVDDGKSTLIGRLLYDTKAILADQLQALSNSRHARVTSSDAAIDLSLLTDGLEAEREQGITIDVAYRYFATAKRKFIVADAPGHEQYTRNLVTGASQADVAVILVDATRVDLSTTPATLLAQTKRHAAIVRMLGIRHVVVAVNKMDLLGFDPAVFEAIGLAITNLSSTLGLPAPQLIPVSALRGDNVVISSTDTPWYSGPSLLNYLEALDLDADRTVQTLRFPVQYVARQDGSAADDYRGYLGRIEAGTLTCGQSVTLLPSGKQATVAEIQISNGVGIDQQSGSIESAVAGQVVAIRLAEDLDISRGDMVVASAGDELSPAVSKQLTAEICWLDSEPLSLARKYLLRHTTNTVFARITAVSEVLDVHTLLQASNRHTMTMNDIGQVRLSLQKPVVCDKYDDLPATGAFVLIDEAGNHTVAAGMILAATAS